MLYVFTVLIDLVKNTVIQYCYCFYFISVSWPWGLGPSKEGRLRNTVVITRMMTNRPCTRA